MRASCFLSFIPSRRQGNCQEAIIAPLIHCNDPTTSDFSSCNPLNVAAPTRSPSQGTLEPQRGSVFQPSASCRRCSFHPVGTEASSHQHSPHNRAELVAPGGQRSTKEHSAEPCIGSTSHPWQWGKMPLLQLVLG